MIRTPVSDLHFACVSFGGLFLWLGVFHNIIWCLCLLVRGRRIWDISLYVRMVAQVGNGCIAGLLVDCRSPSPPLDSRFLGNDNGEAGNDSPA